MQPDKAVKSQPYADVRSLLMEWQQPDGSWKVSTASFHATTGKPRVARTDEVYTYWGTAWATIGLLHTLPPPAASGR